jgi:hypothetical protein
MHRFSTPCFYFVFLTQVAFSQYSIAITEINYNSDNFMEANDWAEIHNYGASSIDISLWKLKDETLVNTYIIPSGTTLNADEYLVLVQDVDTFLMIHSDVTNYTGPFDFGFANGGGSIILQDALGATIREVDYLDTIPWPKGADGLGPSMEIINETAEENDPSNWFAGCAAGAPLHR